MASAGSEGALSSVGRIAAVLASAGCVAAEEEAVELQAAAGGDPGRLEMLVARRCTGEPLAWLVGRVCFCGILVKVHSGVYVPRWQSEPLAVEAARRLPEEGVGVDLCTGAGAIAMVMSVRRPRARVIATEIDPVAAACARDNGVVVVEGDMAAGLMGWAGAADVVTAVVPYVPTPALGLLPRDVLAHEPLSALDGGVDGTRLLVLAAEAGGWLLRPGGSLLLEVGGDQAELLGPALEAYGYGEMERHFDDDGDLRALWCRR